MLFEFRLLTSLPNPLNLPVGLRQEGLPPLEPYSPAAERTCSIRSAAAAAMVRGIIIMDYPSPLFNEWMEREREGCSGLI